MRRYQMISAPVIHPGKGKFTKLMMVIGAVWAVCAVLFTLCGGLFLARLTKCAGTARTAFPEMEKAARLYVRKNQDTGLDAPEV